MQSSDCTVRTRHNGARSRDGINLTFTLKKWHWHLGLSPVVERAIKVDHRPIVARRAGRVACCVVSPPAPGPPRIHARPRTQHPALGGGPPSRTRVRDTCNSDYERAPTLGAASDASPLRARSLTADGTRGGFPRLCVRVDSAPRASACVEERRPADFTFWVA